MGRGLADPILCGRVLRRTGSGGSRPPAPLPCTVRQDEARPATSPAVPAERTVLQAGRPRQRKTHGAQRGVQGRGERGQDVQVKGLLNCSSQDRQQLPHCRPLLLVPVERPGDDRKPLSPVTHGRSHSRLTALPHPSLSSEVGVVRGLGVWAGGPRANSLWLLLLLWPHLCSRA